MLIMSGETSFLLSIFLCWVTMCSTTILASGKAIPMVTSAIFVKKLKVLETVFHPTLLVSHFDWWSEGKKDAADSQLLMEGLVDMESGLHGSFKATSLTCGPHDEFTTERLDQLQTALGSRAVLAVVDHGQGAACYMYYGQMSEVDRLAE